MSATIRVAPLTTWLARGGSEPDARTRVEALMEHLSRESGVDASWRDAGEEVLVDEWDPHALHAVRSLAAHVEYPSRFLFFKLGFRLKTDPRRHSGLQRIFQGADTSFPHLMRHSDNKGLWVPAALPVPMVANEAQWWMVGSVDGVVSELDRLEPLVDPAGARLRAAYDELRRIFTAAHQAGLPVIIDGN